MPPWLRRRRPSRVRTRGAGPRSFAAHLSAARLVNGTAAKASVGFCVHLCVNYVKHAKEGTTLLVETHVYYTCVCTVSVDLLPYPVIAWSSLCWGRCPPGA
jgi:hypothetical protein